jgi:hypothetical protein
VPKTIIVRTSSTYLAELRKTSPDMTRMIANSISAVLMGKIYDCENQPLYWEHLHTDRTVEYLVEPILSDMTIDLKLTEEIHQDLLYWTERSDMRPWELVSVGIATYVNGLKLSIDHVLRWKNSSTRHPIGEFGTVHAIIFPHTMPPARP